MMKSKWRSCELAFTLTYSCRMKATTPAPYLGPGSKRKRWSHVQNATLGFKPALNLFFPLMERRFVGFSLKTCCCLSMSSFRTSVYCRCKPEAFSMFLVITGCVQSESHGGLLILLLFVHEEVEKNVSFHLLVQVSDTTR